MKKVLIASTALVAATMLSAGAASASEKIKLNLGGYSKWWVVGQWQDDSFQSNANAAGAQADYNSVDIKGDNEVYFGGSTTLDNGLQVGIDIQLEAGGHTDTVGGDVIDESYVYLAGGFGKFIVGSKNNGTYLLHVTAPDAAGNWNEGGIMTGGFSIVRPGVAAGTGANNVSGVTPLQGNANTTAIVTDNDAEGITYVAPTFYGLTVGATYKPNSTEDNRSSNSNSVSQTTTGEIFGAGALYANTFGGVGVKVSAGVATYDTNLSTNSVFVGGDDQVLEYSAGAQLSYAGFTLGGSYRQVNADAGNTATAASVDLNANAWDVGLQYASGPYSVSAAYFKSKANGLSTVAGEDEIEFYQVSGKYNLGAGVDALASVGHAKFEDEAGLDAGKNKGWVAMTGLSLAF
jgi:outer membrane protein OmpU